PARTTARACTAPCRQYDTEPLHKRHGNSDIPLFFFNEPPTTDIYTLSLHDALPILPSQLNASVHQASPSNMPAISKSGSVRPTSDRKSTRLNSSHSQISYAVFCLKKKNELRAPQCAAGIVDMRSGGGACGRAVSGSV